MNDPRSVATWPGKALQIAGMTAFLLPAFLLSAAPAMACHEYVSSSDGAKGCGAFNRDLANGSYQNGSSGSSSGGSSSGGSSSTGSTGSSSGNTCT